MMSIDASFFENVHLLRQVVPASYEFKKHFKKEMFDKPNTAGFIHVSHFLLTIYDAKCFERMVTWPIVCKADEKRYRTEIKDYLVIVSQKNSDLCFPPILMSHLLQAGGSKILHLMWKISQVALRTYMKRECNIELLYAPNLGQTNDLSKIHLGNINVRRDLEITQFHTRLKQTTEVIENYIKYTLDELETIKTGIFETKRRLEKCIITVPVNPEIAQRLLNIEDTEIIKLWKESICHNIKYLEHRNQALNKLQELSKKICGLALGLLENLYVLDSTNFPKLSNESVSALCSYSSAQHFISGLQANGAFVLQVFYSLLHHTLKEVLWYFKTNDLPDLSTCYSQVAQFYKNFRPVQVEFQQLSMHIANTVSDMRCAVQDKHLTHMFEKDFLCVTQKELILTSPKIILFLNESTEGTELFGRLWPSPKKEQNKKLFKRYRYNRCSSPKLSLSKLDLNNSMQKTTSEWRSPHRHSTVYKKSSPIISNLSPKYKRLFTNIGDSKTSYFKDHNAASTPNQTMLSTPPKKSNIMRAAKSSRISLDAAAKNLFDLSCEVTNAVASLCGSPLKHNASYN